MMKTIKLLTSTFVIVLFFLINPCSLYAQVAINTDNSMPDGSAMLDIKSTNRGMLIPRMNIDQLDSIQNPATGLMVYLTDLNEFMYFNGTDWFSVNSTKPDLDWAYTAGQVYNIADRIGIGSLPAADVKTTINNTTEYAALKIVTNKSTSDNHARYGISTFLDGVGSGYQIGLQQTIGSFGEGTHIGVKNLFYNPSSGEHYGVFNSLGSNGDNSHYGNFSELYGSGTGAHFGTYNKLNGSGNGSKYGSYNYISHSAGGTHYGVYSESTGSDNYAGYFRGRMYVSDSMGIGTDSPQALLHLAGSFRLSDGSQGDGKILSSDANGNTSWVDGSTLNGGGWTVTGDTLYSALDSTVTIKSGKVGIGTVDPQATLHVSNETLDNTSGKHTLYLTENNNQESSGSFNSAKPYYGIGFRRLWNGGAATDIAGIYAFGSAGYKGGLVFKTNDGGSSGSVPNRNALVIQPNGNIGIGTNSPSQKLQIKGGTDASLSNGSGYFIIGDELGTNIVFDNNEIIARNNESSSSLFIQCSGSTSNTILNENGGNVGIGLTNPAYKLDLPNNTNATGQGRANAWKTYSDGRLKTNRQSINYGLSTIMLLKPMRYLQHTATMNNGKLNLLNDDKNIDNTIGFIAQELYKVIPEAAFPPKDEKSDFWTVDYQKIIPVLTKAIQEQQQQINNLKIENSKMKQKIEEMDILKQRLKKLEQMMNVGK